MNQQEYKPNTSKTSSTRDKDLQRSWLYIWVLTLRPTFRIVELWGFDSKMFWKIMGTRTYVKNLNEIHLWEVSVYSNGNCICLVCRKMWVQYTHGIRIIICTPWRQGLTQKQFISSLNWSIILNIELSYQNKNPDTIISINYLDNKSSSMHSMVKK